MVDASSKWVNSRSKRLFDVTIGLFLLAVTSPLMGAIAALLRMTQGSPVLFRQDRPGKGERVFTLYKFRTMRQPEVGEIAFLTDADRVSRLGRFLRHTSLDELPELFNVLRGDMSLVGPRPLLVQYLGRYSREHATRHRVRPGLTGLVQVSGRRSLRLSERLDLDVQYVKSGSFAMDIGILARTLAQPFRGDAQDVAPLAEVDDVGLYYPG